MRQEVLTSPDIRFESARVLCTECKIRFLDFNLILTSSKIDNNNNKVCLYFDLENEGNTFLRNVSICLHGVITQKTIARMITNIKS